MGNLCRTYHRCVAKVQCAPDHLAHTTQVVSSLKKANSTICVAWFFGALQKQNLRRASWPIRRRSTAHQTFNLWRPLTFTHQIISLSNSLTLKTCSASNSLSLKTYSASSNPHILKTCSASNPLTLKTPASQILPLTYRAWDSPLPLSNSPISHSLSLLAFVFSFYELTATSADDFSALIFQQTNFPVNEFTDELHHLSFSLSLWQVRICCNF